jgi:AcrR family transcriptional regulator
MAQATAERERATPRRRDAAGTRRRILDAARAEFAEHGYAGARVDAIAHRAGANKRMLYAYFGGKRSLFAETLRRKLRERAGLFAGSPDRLADALPRWAEAAAADPAWLRLVTWEALEHGTAPGTAAAEERRAELAAARAWLQDARLDDRLAADQALLAGIALAVFPFAFPQVTELVTGQDARSETFRAEHAVFLRALGERLAPAGEVAP